MSRTSNCIAGGTPSVSLHLASTSTPAPAGVSRFHGTHWKRGKPNRACSQREAGRTGWSPRETVVAVGYHERVHGRWGWPEMGG